jgi:hypothetical protein
MIERNDNSFMRPYVRSIEAPNQRHHHLDERKSPMLRRSTFVLACMALLALLSGCGPRWSVVRQAAPAPFTAQQPFAVLPIDFTGLQVGEKTEMGYLADKDAEAQGSWAGDKLGINEEFASKLMSAAKDHGIMVVPATGPATAPFVIRPVVAWVEPGYYVGVSGGSSMVRMTLQITAPDGRVLDEILVSHGTPGSLYNASISARLRKDGAEIGESVADYLAQRVFGKSD